MAEAPGRVFSQLRSQKVFTVSKKGEEDIWEEEEDKVASLETYFQTAKAEAVAYAANPMLPCLIHSGTGQVHAWVHWYQSWANGMRQLLRQSDTVLRVINCRLVTLLHNIRLNLYFYTESKHNTGP